MSIVVKVTNTGGQLVPSNKSVTTKNAISRIKKIVIRKT